MGMNFISCNGQESSLDLGADVLQLLYHELADGGSSPTVTLGLIASDQLWEVMHWVATGRPYELDIDVHQLLRYGDCEWSRRELDYLADLTEVLHYSDSKMVTAVEAIEIMLPHFQADEVDLRYVHDSDGWRLESGREFERKFGRRVRLPLKRGPFVNPHK